MLRKLTDIKSIPFFGGCVTRHNRGILPFGGLSWAQNIRGRNPSYIKRPGQIKLHSTADSTNGVSSLYQFRKQRIDEKHFFAQMSDGGILEATSAPPTVTVGAFGSEVFTCASGHIPASWANIDDILIMSDGVDQHKTYTGTANYVYGFFVYAETSAAPTVPEHGYDYTDQVTDGQTSTVAVLDAIGTNANQCVFICTPVPATSLTFTIAAANANSVTVTIKYRKSDNTWASVSGAADGTASGGATLAINGTMSWTAPTDEISKYMYGRTGFWYQLTFSGALDAEVEVSKCTFGSGFKDLVNVWDGVIPYAIEAIFYDQSAGTYATYATGSVLIGGMVHSADDTKDRIYFSSPDPIEGVYIDVGATPNTETTTTILGVYYFNGTTWATVGTISDGTSGFLNSGWITWPRKASEPQQFQSTQYHAHWYYIAVATATVSADVYISMFTMPYFDIEELGRGQCCCAWKNMACYSFALYGNYVYITPPGEPTYLNGNDFAIMSTGDGRSNKIAAMVKFHNEMIVFQEEVGPDGGTTTLFQGYSPETFGKLLISASVGTMNSKSVAVVDGVLTATATEEKIKTLCFFLSRYGVCVTDGLTISVVSDDIQNYFDPTKTECIRKGYEKQMWLAHDRAFNVIRIGLVSGSSATTPNVFPVYDINSGTWSFDTPSQELSCLVNVEAGSGNITTVQVAGGTDDGFVYLSNSGVNDVDQAIDSYVTMEMNYGAKYIQLNEMLIRCTAVAAASAGDITLTFYKNGISAGTKTLTMAPEVTSEAIRRHRFNLNLCSQNIAVKIQNNAVDKTMELLDIGFDTDLYEGR